VVNVRRSTDKDEGRFDATAHLIENFRKGFVYCNDQHEAEHAFWGRMSNVQKSRS